MTIIYTTDSRKEKEREVQWVINYMSSKQLKFQSYTKLKLIFSNNIAGLEDFDKKTQSLICKKLFFYKFLISCSNAENVRCGKKQGYEDVKFMLGDKKGLIRRLYKNRPDLVEKGITICRSYIQNGFVSKYAPVIHRKDRKLHYQWENIDIMTVSEHDKETQKERQEDEKNNLFINV